MKGISKCSGQRSARTNPGEAGKVSICPLRDTCLRFTMPSDNLWQSNISPVWDGERKTCWSYLQDTKSVNKRIAAQRGEK